MGEIIEKFVKELNIDANKVKITKINNRYKITSEKELAVQDLLAIMASLPQEERVNNENTKRN